MTNTYPIHKVRVSVLNNLPFTLIWVKSMAYQGIYNMYTSMAHWQGEKSILCYHILLIAKYGLIISLWLITTLATAQNWKKKNT
jgi:hypothetical protein